MFLSVRLARDIIPTAFSQTTLMRSKISSVFCFNMSEVKLVTFTLLLEDTICQFHCFSQRGFQISFTNNTDEIKYKLSLCLTTFLLEAKLFPFTLLLEDTICQFHKIFSWLKTNYFIICSVYFKEALSLSFPTHTSTR